MLPELLEHNNELVNTGKPAVDGKRCLWQGTLSDGATYFVDLPADWRPTYQVVEIAPVAEHPDDATVTVAHQQIPELRFTIPLLDALRIPNVSFPPVVTVD